MEDGRTDEVCGLTWWYLSFADEVSFRGALIVQATAFLDAVRTAHVLGISPGGQVHGDEIPNELVPAKEWCHRLLSKSEVQQLWPEAKSLGEWEDDEAAGQRVEENL